MKNKFTSPIYTLGIPLNIDNEIINTDYLYAMGIHRTKLKLEEMPPYYCKISNSNQIAYVKTTNIIDVKYLWRNYSPSMLLIGLNGDYIKKVPYDDYGNCIRVFKKDDIQRILKYIEKYSPQVDLSTVYKEINAEKEKK